MAQTKSFINELKMHSITINSLGNSPNPNFYFYYTYHKELLHTFYTYNKIEMFFFYQTNRKQTHLLLLINFPRSTQFSITK